MRERWTDDRMDDLVQRVDTGFAQVHDDSKAITAELRSETQVLRADMNKRFDSVDQRFNAVDQRFIAIDQHFDALNRRFDNLQTTLIAAILAGFLSLLIAHFT